MIRTGSKGSAGPENADLQDDIRSSSPGPSVCSDSELPYISYTVSRPIGGSIVPINLIYASLIVTFKKKTDSPKLQPKHLQHGKSASSSPVRTRNLASKASQSRVRPASFPNKITKAHTIVVVKPAVENNDLETDEDQHRLRVR
jgi:BLOC-1 related complex subunit 5